MLVTASFDYFLAFGDVTGKADTNTWVCERKAGTNADRGDVGTNAYMREGVGIRLIRKDRKSVV